MTNEALMASYVQGDARSFNQLFARLAPAVHKFFVSSFRCPAVADDLLQTTFLKFHRARADYNPAFEVKPWLFTIAARVRLDELRRRYAAPPASSEEELANVVDEHDGVARTAEQQSVLRDRQLAVQRALERLPEAQRVVIHLHRYERMTFAQIAEVLGTTAGAVKLRAFRGYEQLRAELKGVVSDEVES
jgi:RNA polymerase sigma-70 factor (ECF subfamily)